MQMRFPVMRTIPPVRLFTAVVIFASLASGQTAKNTGDTLKHKYHVIQVGSFEVQPGVDLPPDLVAGLPQAVASALKESKIFQEVLLQDQLLRRTLRSCDSPALSPALTKVVGPNVILVLEAPGPRSSS